MSTAPFDHPFLSGLLGDAETAALFSAESDIAAMLRFEAALAQAEADEAVIPAEAGPAIAAAFEATRLDMARLALGAARDGVVVPDLVRQLRAMVGAPHGEHVHFGATSQDVIDTSLALRLGDVLQIFTRRLDGVVAALDALDATYGATPMMAHTRMQEAIPVTASRKILSWRDPLLRHLARLPAVADEVRLLSLGGAAGTLDTLGDKGPAVAARMGAALGLRVVARPRHNERDGIVALASWLALVTGSLGKMGQDIVLASQSELGEIRLASGGGSSAMPHKVNPVGAEVLVALARFNAIQAGGMQQAMVHENERSGAAWTLEWMLLPQMAVATGAALLTAAKLLDGLTFRARRG